MLIDRLEQLLYALHNSEHQVKNIRTVEWKVIWNVKKKVISQKKKTFTSRFQVEHGIKNLG